MNRHVILRGGLAMAVALAMAGCALRPSMSTDIYEARLSGSQEVPPNSSPGTGTAEVRLDRHTHIVHWKVTYSGLTGPAKGAHIHGPAQPGQNAPVLIPFASVGTSPIEGQAPLTPAQEAELAAGQLYVNVHTPAFPAGEIRGQLHLRH